MNQSQRLKDPKPTTVQDFTSEELAFARKVESRLRSKEKIRREEDRVGMAKNLGAMFERVQQRVREEGGTFPLSQLFDEAFGEKSGESQYKKRGRLLALSSDEITSDDYAAYGNKYLDIVEALSRHLEFPEQWPEERKYHAAVSRLVEGTSYDYVGGYADRAIIEYQREIEKQLGKVVDKLLEDKDVDLDWMRFWTREHPVKIKGPTGFIGTISSPDWSSCLGDSQIGTLSVHGSVDNRLAPCVRIARVFSNYNISKYLTIKVEKQPSQITSEDIWAEVAKLVGEQFLEECHNAADYEELEAKLKELDEVEGWQESPGTQNFDGLWVKSFIDLELRYDEGMARWRPVILSRWPGAAQVQEFTYSIREDQLILLVDTIYDNVFAILDEASDEYACFLIFRADQFLHRNEPSKCPIFDQNVDCGFYPPQSEFYNFLLAKIGESPSRFEIETVDSSNNFPFQRSLSYTTGYVKAPTNSLAFWILNNLAYAPEEERIDTLFLKDAREKCRKLRGYADQCEKDYEEAISRL